MNGHDLIKILQKDPEKEVKIRKIVFRNSYYENETLPMDESDIEYDGESFEISGYEG